MLFFSNVLRLEFLSSSGEVRREVRKLFFIYRNVVGIPEMKKKSKKDELKLIKAFRRYFVALQLKLW